MEPRVYGIGLNTRVYGGYLAKIVGEPFHFAHEVIPVACGARLFGRRRTHTQHQLRLQRLPGRVFLFSQQQHSGMGLRRVS